MRILWHELKKILSFKMLLLLAIVNGLFYFLFIEFYIMHFPNGRPGLDFYNVSVEVLEKYGMEIDEAEYLEMKETYAAEIKKVDHFLQSTPKYAEKGLTTYEDTLNIEDEDLWDLEWELLNDEIGDTLWELQARETFLSIYESEETILDGWIDTEMSHAQQKRVNELKVNKDWMVFPDVVLANYKFFIESVAIAIFISIVTLISPIFIKDRLGQINPIQYTAKKGRGLFKVKIGAGFFATFLVISGLLAVYFSLYATNNTSMFFNIPIHKLTGNLSWYDPTFFQYIILTVLAVYLIGFISMMVAMAVSSIAPNYISLIGIQIPYVYLLNVLIIHYLISRVISIYVAQWLVPTSYMLLLIGSVLLITVMLKREMKRDLL